MPETASWLEVVRLVGGVLVVVLSLLLLRDYLADRRAWGQDGRHDRIVGWWIAGAVRLKLTIAFLGAVEAYSAYSSALTPAGQLPPNVYGLNLLRIAALAVLVLLAVDRYVMRRHFLRYAGRRDRRWSDRPAEEILSKERAARDPRGER